MAFPELTQGRANYWLCATALENVAKEPNEKSSEELRKRNVKLIMLKMGVFPNELRLDDAQFGAELGEEKPWDFDAPSKDAADALDELAEIVRSDLGFSTIVDMMRFLLLHDLYTSTAMAPLFLVNRFGNQKE